MLLTSGQRNLQVPNFGGVSFESSESQETSEFMQEQLKQLLGDQLAIPISST
ncbi:GM22541 [Drosophila sechellia]|uniref:GM22541 n=1 Tax=Drosophila sechellia TaxID=7238 RepID=B4IK96_DROSE|nr:GM22541 [Drosophila sechellia]